MGLFDAICSVAGAINPSAEIEKEYTKRNAKIRIPLKQQTYTFKEDYTLYDEKDFFDFNKNLTTDTNLKTINKAKKMQIKKFITQLEKLKQGKE
ncbi:hypothetical protein [Campylobacter insulaenigrae]|uniref:hypothetical protein n=1 Tax=Campylobacter insulaenigrae TaxID=260714 RepID=UPI002152D667|nr:hypothetical protein [Campylobacter insulaenigrae]MCR6573604.1 hypothetical protein [Campylobacter insulaenigrae]MCR6579633.1 hypothetical protein [Campylobacter insulaenigrae]